MRRFSESPPSPLPAGALPPPALQERIRGLWDRLADFDSAAVETALASLREGLCGLADAEHADWLGILHLGDGAAADGQSLPVHWVLRAGPGLPATGQAAAVDRRRDGIDEGLIRMAGSAGRFRAARLRDLHPAAWFDGPAYRREYLDRRCGDAIYVVSPIDREVESIFGVFRAAGRPPFCEAERDLVAYALRGLKWFQRRLLSSHGFVSAAKPSI